MVKDFDFFAKMKIQFKRGMVHCLSAAEIQKPCKLTCLYRITGNLSFSFALKTDDDCFVDLKSILQVSEHRVIIIILLWL